MSAALVGAFTGGAAGYIGAAGNGLGTEFSHTEKVFAHGAVGGISSKLQGGKFGHGFLSSAFSKSISGRIHSSSLINRNPVMGGVAMAMIGGTASALGGGKFANGARTSALQYLFNEVREVIKRIDTINYWTKDPNGGFSSIFSDLAVDKITTGKINPFKAAYDFVKWRFTEQTDWYQFEIKKAEIVTVNYGTEYYTADDGYIAKRETMEFMNKEYKTISEPKMIDSKGFDNIGSGPLPRREVVGSEFFF